MKFTKETLSAKKIIRLALLLAIIAISTFSCKPKTALPNAPYVVLSPEIGEILASLGAIDEISGVVAECDFPPEMSQKTVVGNFGAIDKEKVIALKPEIVFSSALEQESIAEDFRKLGIRIETGYPKNLDGMMQEILRIGKIIGKEERAQALVDSLQNEMITIAENAKSLKKMPKVYLEIYRDPLMSVADNSLVGELIEHAGGDNIFSVLERDYSRVNPEAVIQAMPDIMICYSRDSLENIRARKGWDATPAIKNGQIYFEEDISPDLIQRAGPRAISGMKRLFEIYQQWDESDL